MANRKLQTVALPSANSAIGRFIRNRNTSKPELKALKDDIKTRLAAARQRLHDAESAMTSEASSSHAGPSSANQESRKNGALHKDKKRKRDALDDSDRNKQKTARKNGDKLDKKSSLTNITLSVPVPHASSSASPLPAPDFSLRESFVPQRVISEPWAPTPRRQADVDEDFTKAKPGTQVQLNTFQTFLEAYIRPFGEDDLAFLAPNIIDDSTLYEIPALGSTSNIQASAPFLSFTPNTHTQHEEALVLRNQVLSVNAPIDEATLRSDMPFLGPTTEKLLGALIDCDETDISATIDQDAAVASSSSSLPPDDAAAATSPYKSVTETTQELEARLAAELRYVGLADVAGVGGPAAAAAAAAAAEPGAPGPAAPDTDQVLETLRQMQHRLRRQVEINEARKAVLIDIVRDRIAYQEFETLRDSLSKAVDTGWTKRLKSLKKRGKSANKRNPVTGNMEPRPNAPVSLNLLYAIRRRNRFIDGVLPMVTDTDGPGGAARYTGFPSESVYPNMVDDVEAEEPLFHAYGISSHKLGHEKHIAHKLQETAQQCAALDLADPFDPSGAQALSLLAASSASPPPEVRDRYADVAPYARKYHLLDSPPPVHGFRQVDLPSPPLAPSPVLDAPSEVVLPDVKKDKPLDQKKKTKQKKKDKAG